LSLRVKHSSDKARANLEQFAKLRGVAVEEISTLRFEGAMLEQARALGAAYDVGRGMGTLITGQDVADQLAGDAIAAALKEERARRRETERSAGQDGGKQAASGDQNGGAPDGTGESPEPVDEEAAKEERRREREAEREARRGRPPTTPSSARPVSGSSRG